MHNTPTSLSEHRTLPTPTPYKMSHGAAFLPSGVQLHLTP